ncbi:MAG: hypothetical protein COW84_08110 [Gammaproteobacteria bacterium CG22_combo_CG10-13_8_21_14_all_40_8]|nr:MAG: hypothetical protein COW84_08110 [Gammaproteobacteria bacterium CG22_combo_CG10-13_8_21_14_all_40_8]
MQPLSARTGFRPQPLGQKCAATEASQCEAGRKAGEAGQEGALVWESTDLFQTAWSAHARHPYCLPIISSLDMEKFLISKNISEGKYVTSAI